jgi:uncharacterized OB-fold protein
MEIARHWRLKRQRYGLVGEVCSDCGHRFFPPREKCPQCSSRRKTECAFSGEGDVYSFTTIYEAPAGYDEDVPFSVALVKLEEGPMVTAQLTDLGGQVPEIGLPVEMVTRRLRQDGDERGVIIYSYKFRPRLKSGG